ncbi:hypothetical protein EDB89DRAFT_1912945 [Lactarius sanguifluus]|nr:hypothetical protein EDB89DRAFT_1912945 [Lactarius sanguifluus]
MSPIENGRETDGVPVNVRSLNSYGYPSIQGVYNWLDMSSMKDGRETHDRKADPPPPAGAGWSINHVGVSDVGRRRLSMNDRRFSPSAGDTRQGVFPAAVESRRVDVFPLPHTMQFTPPMTPDIVDSGFYSLSNTMPSLLDPSGGSLSTCSPFASGYQPMPVAWDYGFGREFGTPPITPTSPTFPLGCAMDDTHDIEMSDPIVRQRRPKSTHNGSLSSILRDLRRLRLTAVDLLMAIIDGNGEFEGFRNAFFSPKNRASLIGLLDRLIQDDKGKAIVEEWMSPHALRLVCEKVHVEMEAAKPHLRMNTTDVSPEFIEHWDIHQIMEPLATPILRTVLEAAGESKVSVAKPKSAKSKNRLTAFLIIMAQIHYLRSWNSARVQIGLGLQAWACGTSRQMVDVLHRTGLTVSYNSISSMVQSLADRSIDRAKAASLLPHALAYDNINISSSIYVEQGPNTMSKVQSGTFAVIYELLNARAEDMDMKPLIKNLRRSSPLVISDLRMTLATGQSYISQVVVTIVRILTKYVKGFETQQSDPMLQHPPRRPLPVGHKTVFHPLRASTIEEASVDGNLLVHDDVYLVQLKRTSEDLDKMAVPTFNDQLTNARIWGGQQIRRKDVSYWETREIFQLGFGNFAKAEPTPGGLLDCARRIAEKYASVEPVFDPLNPKAPPKDLVSGVESTKPVVDVVHRNVTLLTHDLLLVVELVDAIATGDFGQIEDILPNLACMFRGSGSNNYSMEILHLIFNIKEVWTPTFANIMRDNMLVNPSGLPGHAMGIDMNIEHLIRYLKVVSKSSVHVDHVPILSDSDDRHYLWPRAFTLTGTDLATSPPGSITSSW